MGSISKEVLVNNFGNWKERWQLRGPNLLSSVYRLGSLAMLGGGIAMEVTDYRPTPMGTIVAVGGAVGTLVSCWPRQFEAGFRSTLSYIRSLPETDGSKSNNHFR